MIHKADKENIVKTIENDARDYMEKHHMSGHDFAHLDRVRKLSKYIGKLPKNRRCTCLNSQPMDYGYQQTRFCFVLK